MDRERLSKFYIKLKLADKRASIDDKEGSGQGTAKRTNLSPPGNDNVALPPVMHSVPATQNYADHDTDSEDDTGAIDVPKEGMAMETDESTSDSG